MKININLIILLQMSIINCFLLNNRSIENEALSTNSNKDCNSENFYFWQLTNINKSAFFLGTIHVPFIKVWNKLPKFIEDKIKNSDIIYFELDLLNQKIRKQLMICQLISDGKSLKNYLPKNIYKKIKIFIRLKRNEFKEKNNFDFLTKNWKFKKPIWITFLINYLIENDNKYSKIPTMDNLININARKLNKTIKSIENVNDQCKPLDNLKLDYVVTYLNFTLNNYFNNKIKNKLMDIENLISEYKCGKLDHRKNFISNGLNLNSNNQSEQLKIKLINNFFHHQLIYHRNEKMTNTIDYQIKKYPNKTLFFIFGTAHFLGFNSILDNLSKNYFYQIQKIKITNNQLENDSSPHLFKNYKLNHNSNEEINFFKKNFILNQQNYNLTFLSKKENINEMRKIYNDFWLYFKLDLN